MKITLSLLAVLATIGTASAADLPKAKSVGTLAPVSEQAIRPYIQGNIGIGLDNEYTVFGGKAGLETKYLRTDLGYDYFAKRNLFSANIYLQAPVYAFTPYIGAGLGRVYDSKAKFDDVWLATVGTRYNINTNWALDVNVRQISGIDDRKLQDRQVTGGIVYRF